MSARSVQAKKCFRASEQLFQAVSIRLRNDRRGSLFLHNPSSVVREHKRGNVWHQHIQFSCCLQSIYYRRGHIENYETGFTCWAFWTPSAPFTASKTSKSSASNTSRNMRLDRVIIDNHNEIATLHTPHTISPFVRAGNTVEGVRVKSRPGPRLDSLRCVAIICRERTPRNRPSGCTVPVTPYSTWPRLVQRERDGTNAFFPISSKQLPYHSCLPAGIDTDAGWRPATLQSNTSDRE